jgi:DNA mismatch repair protein MutL
MPIRVLLPEVASRIAAGEVVERPASVVKELVENSLDAGASEIRIEVRDGGRRLIRVVDDGSGIPAAEVTLAFERHATSKLTSADDLERIATLGFRGEALASIASVAQVLLVTRHVDEAVGVQVRIDGGRLISHEPRGAPPGTAITVENLFYNVPARLKFMRAPATEAGHIAATVRNFALAFPERRFSLTSDGRLAFRSPGTGNLHDVLVKAQGLSKLQEMIPIDPVAAGDGVRVSGYVSLPSLSRSNRNLIDLFLNRRHIQDRTLTFAVTEAYRNRLMVGRYPVAVVLIEMDPSLVDVNVHPAKAEVRFQDERAVFRAVQKAIVATLNERAPVPELRSDALWASPGWAERRQALLSAGQLRQPLELDSWQQSAALLRTDDESSTAQALMSTLVPDDLDADDLWQEALAAPEPEAAPAAEVAPQAGGMPILRVVGQMGATFIVAEGPEGMYLVDQHAAHERILFEQMMAQQATGVPQQGLLEPLVFEADTVHGALLAEYGPALEHTGFGVEPFGSDTWLVRSIPAVYARVDPRRALEEVLEGIADGQDLVGDTRETGLIAVICKRAAIKGGQALSLEEMRQLVRQLEACRSPSACPHGRPTMLVLSTAQLEREFGRRG